MRLDRCLSADTDNCGEIVFISHICKLGDRELGEPKTEQIQTRRQLKMSDNREYEIEMEVKKKRTCKLLYNQGRIHHRSELLKGLSRLVEKESNEAVYSLNKPKEWYICFSTENKAIEFSTLKIIVENREYQPKLKKQTRERYYDPLGPRLHSERPYSRTF